MLFRLVVRVVLPAVVGAFVVYILTGQMPKVYSSYETLYFPMNPAGGIGALGPIGGAPSGGDAGALQGLGGAIVYPLIGSGSQTAAGIVTSHTSLQAVVRRLHLDQVWHATELNATKILSTQVSAETDRSGLLMIRVNSTSPGLCVAIDRELLSYLKTRTAELSQSSDTSNKRLIADRLAVAQKDLDQAQRRVEAVLQSTPLAGVTDIQTRFLDAQKALTSAKTSRDEEHARLAELEAQYRRLADNATVGGTANALTTLNPAFAELVQELQRRRLQLSDAMIAFSNTSPKVFQAQRQFANAEAIASQIKASTRTSAGIVSPGIIDARAEMAALDESVRANEEALNAALKNVAESPKQYADSTIARSNFEAALSKVNLLKQEQDRAEIIESRDPSRFALVDEPYEDPTPISPHRMMMSGVAFLVVAGLCFIPFLIRMVKAAERSAYASSESAA